MLYCRLVVANVDDHPFDELFSQPLKQVVNLDMYADDVSLQLRGVNGGRRGGQQ